MIALCHQMDVTASILFSMALNFKHMALYFAPAFFVFLLMRCRDHKTPVRHFLKVGHCLVCKRELK